MASKKLEAVKAKSSSDPDLKAGMDATITDGSYATSLTSFEVKMAKICSNFHFIFHDGNQNKNKAWSRSHDKITVPFDWEFHQGIKFTCCTLLRFVAEQQLSSRVSHSVAA